MPKLVLVRVRVRVKVKNKSKACVDFERRPTAAAAHARLKGASGLLGAVQTCRIMRGGNFCLPHRRWWRQQSSSADSADSAEDNTENAFQKIDKKLLFTANFLEELINTVISKQQSYSLAANTGAMSSSAFSVKVPAGSICEEEALSSTIFDSCCYFSKATDEAMTWGGGGGGVS